MGNRAHHSRLSGRAIALGALIVAVGLADLCGAGQWAIAQPAMESERQPEPKAQALALRTLQRHPELAHVVLHVTPPGLTDVDNLIIASTMGRIGKRADDDDLRIMRTGTIEAVVAKSGDRYNVSLPMLDRSGRSIGIVALGFHYVAGDDPQKLRFAAAGIRDELRRQIVSAKSLFSKH